MKVREFLTLKNILIVTLLCSLLIVTKPVSASTLTLTITTSKQTYTAGETVIIQGDLTLDGTPVNDALVALEIDTQYRYYVFRTLQTGTIEGGNWLVEITDLYPCDEHGTYKDTFARGSTAYVKVVWKNNSTASQSIMVACYIQDSTGSPLTAFYHKVSTPPGTSSSIMTSFEIPSTAPTGTATIYASLYTDSPKNGGVPYCPEKNATFTITSTSTGTQSSTSSSTSSFQTTITLPKKDVILGNYTIYGSCQYDSTTALSTAKFQVILLGDIDNNGKVDGWDITIACAAYGSYPNHPRWNPAADINNDDKVDGWDITIICLNYGNTGV
jgi:hypothetical protein